MAPGEKLTATGAAPWVRDLTDFGRRLGVGLGQLWFAIIIVCHYGLLTRDLGRERGGEFLQWICAGW